MRHDVIYSNNRQHGYRRLRNLATGVSLLAMSWAAAQHSAAASQPSESRIAASVVDTIRSPLPTFVNPQLARGEDLGGAPSNLVLEHLLLILRRPASADAALATLATEQQDRASPNYHHWLSPSEYVQKFGVSATDLQTWASWLTSHGLSVNGIVAGGNMIDVSGSVASLRAAFGVDMHRVKVGQTIHLANVAPPTVPQAFSDAIIGIAGLDDFHTQSYVKMTKPQASLGNGGLDAVGPQDFATIYDLHPLWSSGVVGSGRTIVIVGRSEVVQSDVDAFNTQFAVRRESPVAFIRHSDSCRNPGLPQDGDAVEAAIDVEWAGAVAPGAKIVLAACASTQTTDGIALAALQAVSLAPDVVSVSFGACERDVSPSDLAFYNTLWQQASIQGTSVVVSAGDSGAEGCDRAYEHATSGAWVNGLSSTPNNVSVGGTDFQDRLLVPLTPGQPITSNATYWRGKNGRGDSSARSYVPETTWNDTCTDTRFINYLQDGGVPVSRKPSDIAANCGIWAFGADGYFPLLEGGGGGFSKVYGQPAWQLPLHSMAPVNARQTPDISLFSGAGYVGHALFFCDQSLLGTCTWDTASADLGGGTSFAAPAFAGILALIDQHKSDRQGNAGYRLYQLGLDAFGPQTGAGSPTLKGCDAARGNRIRPDCVFHSVSTGTIRQACWVERDGNVFDPNPHDAVQCYFGPKQWSFMKGNPFSYAYNGIQSFSGKLLSFDPGYFDAALGYSVATGLGSPDAANLVANW